MKMESNDIVGTQDYPYIKCKDLIPEEVAIFWNLFEIRISKENYEKLPDSMKKKFENI